MSELPEGIPPAEPPRPTESASGIVLRRGSAGGWQILLGLRSRRSRFLPGHLACPGGRLEERDRPSEPGAYARCAAREVAEETGAEIPPESWISSGERTTPPIFPLRFRTRFFVGELPADRAVPDISPSPDEIERLRLGEPRAVLEDWAAGRVRVPPPTLAILRALEDAGPRPPGELAEIVAAANRLEERVPRIEFSPGTWMLPVRSETLPPASHTNVWMPGGRRFAIIDPGSTLSEENRRLLEVVERRRGIGDEPVAVLLTHGHRDHAGGALEVASALGLPLRAHRRVLESVARGGGGARTASLDDGAELDLDGERLRAIHTPGHAPGHLAFHLIGAGRIIAGDLISGQSTILIDPDDGDMGEYLESLRRTRDLSCRLLLPGHGPPLPGNALDRLIQHRLGRERAIVKRLAAHSRPLSDIAGEAYEDLPELPPALVERQTLSHLILLERRGQVRRDDRSGRLWSIVGR